MGGGWVSRKPSIWRRERATASNRRSHRASWGLGRSPRSRRNASTNSGFAYCKRVTSSKVNSAEREARFIPIRASKKIKGAGPHSASATTPTTLRRNHAKEVSPRQAQLSSPVSRSRRSKRVHYHPCLWPIKIPSLPLEPKLPPGFRTKFDPFGKKFSPNHGVELRYKGQ